MYVCRRFDKKHNVFQRLRLKLYYGSDKMMFESIIQISTCDASMHHQG